MLKDIVLQIEGTDTVFDSAADGFIADVRVPVPAVRKRMTEVPGMSGLLDWSDALLGDVEFENIEIGITLIQRRGNEYDIENFINSFHGKRVLIFAKGETAYRVGRLEILSDDKASELRRLTLRMDAEPFRFEHKKTTVALNSLMYANDVVFAETDSEDWAFNSSLPNGSLFPVDFSITYWRSDVAESGDDSYSVYAIFPCAPGRNYGIAYSAELLETNSIYYNVSYSIRCGLSNTTDGQIDEVIDNPAKFDSGEYEYIVFECTAKIDWKNDAFYGGEILAVSLYIQNVSLELVNEGRKIVFPIIKAPSSCNALIDGRKYTIRANEHEYRDIFLTPGSHTALFWGNSGYELQIEYEEAKIV